VSTKCYKVNSTLPVILFAYRTQLDLTALCLRFSPPNQEKDATLFLTTCCFYPADGMDNLSRNIGTKYQPTSCNIRDERKPQACIVCCVQGQLSVSHKHCLNRTLNEVISN